MTARTCVVTGAGSGIGAAVTRQRRAAGTLSSAWILTGLIPAPTCPARSSSGGSLTNSRPAGWG